MTDKRLLILLATDSAVPSGVGEHMLTLAAALRATHEVALAFPSQGDGTRFLLRSDEAGFETVAVDRGLSGWLDTRCPAIFHVHAGVGWEGHELLEAGWNAMIPVLRTEHLPYLITDPEQQARHRLATSLAEALVAVSEAVAVSYRAQGFSRVITIRNGIEAPVPRRGRAGTRAVLAIADDAPVCLTVARFTAQKGHAALLHAAAEVSLQAPGLHFLLVGDGPEMADMQALAASLALPNVTFLGERADVPDLLTAADLLVLPSLFEGLPLVVLEAMALGLPVVATRIGGTVEALSGDHPFLVPAGDPSLLAAMIVAALADEPGRRIAGKRGRQRFEERFTAARMGRETDALYRAIVEGMCTA
ncbi:glycosyltransferase family 4 protein [Mesorhizobium sp. SB112]|uniref:glycosyltransferase family 4 protein n=1 Tax=Mesorhizobium sp. SB112 TaxID=3151853 RepID=UPI0032652A04